VVDLKLQIVQMTQELAQAQTDTREAKDQSKQKVIFRLCLHSSITLPLIVSLDSRQEHSRCQARGYNLTSGYICRRRKWYR
jgi:hypothetical protein